MIVNMNTNTKLRPVTVFEKRYMSREVGYQINEVGSGVFHGFSVAYQEFETGPGNYAIAIVEMPDGSVITPLAENIRFDDK